MIYPLYQNLRSFLFFGCCGGKRIVDSAATPLLETKQVEIKQEQQKKTPVVNSLVKTSKCITAVKACDQAVSIIPYGIAAAAMVVTFNNRLDLTAQCVDVVVAGNNKKPSFQHLAQFIGKQDILLQILMHAGLDLFTCLTVGAQAPFSFLNVKKNYEKYISGVKTIVQSCFGAIKQKPSCGMIVDAFEFLLQASDFVFFNILQSYAGGLVMGGVFADATKKFGLSGKGWDIFCRAVVGPFLTGTGYGQGSRTAWEIKFIDRLFFPLHWTKNFCFKILGNKSNEAKISYESRRMRLVYPATNEAELQHIQNGDSDAMVLAKLSQLKYPIYKGVVGQWVVPFGSFVFCWFSTSQYWDKASASVRMIFGNSASAETVAKIMGLLAQFAFTSAWSGAICDATDSVLRVLPSNPVWKKHTNPQYKMPFYRRISNLNSSGEVVVYCFAHVSGFALSANNVPLVKFNGDSIDFAIKCVGSIAGNYAMAVDSIPKLLKALKIMPEDQYGMLMKKQEKWDAKIEHMSPEELKSFAEEFDREQQSVAMQISKFGLVTKARKAAAESIVVEEVMDTLA